MARRAIPSLRLALEGRELDCPSVSGPSSLHVWFASVPSEEVHKITGHGDVRHVVVLGSIARWGRRGLWSTPG
jgi:hypothetical protein